MAANENAVRSWLNRISPWGREGVRFARGGAEGRAGGEGTEGRSVQRTGESGNGAALRHSDTRAHVKWRVHARRKAGIGSLLRFAIRASSSSSDTFVLLCCLTKKKKKRRNRDRFFLPPPLPPFSFLLVFGARVSANRCNFFFFFVQRGLSREYSQVLARLLVLPPCVWIIHSGEEDFSVFSKSGTGDFDSIGSFGSG